MICNNVAQEIYDAVSLYSTIEEGVVGPKIWRRKILGRKVWRYRVDERHADLLDVKDGVTIAVFGPDSPDSPYAKLFL